MPEKVIEELNRCLALLLIKACKEAQTEGGKSDGTGNAKAKSKKTKLTKNDTYKIYEQLRVDRFPW